MNHNTTYNENQVSTKVYHFNETSCPLIIKDKICQAIKDKTFDEKDNWVVLLQLTNGSVEHEARIKNLSNLIEEDTGVKTIAMQFDPTSKSEHIAELIKTSNKLTGRNILLIDSNLVIQDYEHYLCKSNNKLI